MRLVIVGPNQLHTGLKILTYGRKDLLMTLLQAALPSRIEKDEMVCNHAASDRGLRNSRKKMKHRLGALKPTFCIAKHFFKVYFFII